MKRVLFAARRWDRKALRRLIAVARHSNRDMWREIPAPGLRSGGFPFPVISILNNFTDTVGACLDLYRIDPRARPLELCSAVTFPGAYSKQVRDIITVGIFHRKEVGQVAIKVAELVGESPDNWKDAVQAAVWEASKTISNITGVEIYNLTANVDNGRITEYKANVKIAYAE